MNGKQSKRLRRLARQHGNPNAQPEIRITRKRVAGKFSLDDKGNKVPGTIDLVTVSHGKQSPRRLAQQLKRAWSELPDGARAKFAAERKSKEEAQ